MSQGLCMCCCGTIRCSMRHGLAGQKGMIIMAGCVHLGVCLGNRVGSGIAACGCEGSGSRQGCLACWPCLGGLLDQVCRSRCVLLHITALMRGCSIQLQDTGHQISDVFEDPEALLQPSDLHGAEQCWNLLAQHHTQELPGLHVFSHDVEHSSTDPNCRGCRDRFAMPAARTCWKALNRFAVRVATSVP